MAKLPVFVDFKKLKSVSSKGVAANPSAEATSDVLNEYINLMANMLATAKSTDEKELALLTMSLQNWLLFAKGGTSKPKPDNRSICIASLGNVYNPEAAYEHPVIVLEQIPGEDLILVVPTKSSAYSVAYDPVTKEGNKFVMKADESNNFDGKCGIELKQLRIISTNRIVAIKSKIDAQKYQEIKDRLVELYFPKHHERTSLISTDLMSNVKKYTKEDYIKYEKLKDHIEKEIKEYINKRSSEYDEYSI